MKKLFCLISIFLIMLVSVDKVFAQIEKPIILFNKNPINQDNVAEFCDTFNRGEKIHYVITMPKKNHSRFLYIQVIKMGKYERLGYELVWSDTVRLTDEQIYYYNDYFVMNDSGTYVMKVYSKDKPKKVYALSQFWVR